MQLVGRVFHQRLDVIAVCLIGLIAAPVTASEQSEAPVIRAEDMAIHETAKALRAQTPWERRMTGMDGGSVNSLAIDSEMPGHVYAGTDFGLYKTTNAGATWNLVDLPIRGRVTDIAINAFDTSIIHVAVPCAYVRSTDRGINWTLSFPATCVENIDLDPSNNRVLIHNLRGDINSSAAAQYSTNGGLNFTTMSLPDNPALTSITMDVIYGAPGGYILGYGSSTNKLYKTVDNAMSWQDITSNIRGSSNVSIAEVAVRPGHSSQYLLSEFKPSTPSGSRIYQSTNGGDTWTEIAFGAFPPINSIEMSFDPANNALVHYVNLRSTDGGFNWTELGSGLGFRGRAEDLVATTNAPNQIFGVAEGVGVERSDDAGASWVRMNTGLDAADVVDHAVLDSSLVAVADKLGIFRSDNMGRQWQKVLSGPIEDQEPVSLSFSADGQDGFATFFGSAGERTLATSTDGGQNWSTFDVSGVVDTMGTVIAIGNGMGVAAVTSSSETGAVRVDTSGTVSAFAGFDGGTGSPLLVDLAVDPADADHLLAGYSLNGNHLYQSSDGGLTWSAAGTGLDSRPADIQFDSNITGTVFVVNDDGFHRSLDGGSTFSLLSATPSDTASIATSTRFTDLLVTGRNSSNRGGLVSSDGGLSWLGLGDAFIDGSTFPADVIHLTPTGSIAVGRSPANFGGGIAVKALSTVGNTLVAPQPAANDLFGEALAASGGRIAVGVPGDDESGSDSGAVFIYARVGADVILEQKIAAPAGMISGFGQALAMDGDRLAVGTAGLGSPGAKGNALAAALFERLNGVWQIKTSLSPTTTSSAQGFGSAIALDGDTMVVGAPDDDMAAAGGGAVYVYQIDQSGANQMQSLASSNPAPGGKFGQGLTINNGMVAIGSPFGGSGSILSGSVELYNQVATNLQSATIVQADSGSSDDQFGTAVALNANGMMIVGAPGESSNTGSAYVFNFDGNNAVQLGQLTATIPAIGGTYGTSVAIAGDQFAVGAPGRFKAFVYNGQLTLLTTVNAQPGQAGFGNAIAISNQNLVVGAPDTDNGTGEAQLLFDLEVIFRTGFE